MQTRYSLFGTFYNNTSVHYNTTWNARTVSASDVKRRQYGLAAVSNMIKSLLPISPKLGRDLSKYKQWNIHITVPSQTRLAFIEQCTYKMYITFTLWPCKLHRKYVYIRIVENHCDVGACSVSPWAMSWSPKSSEYLTYYLHFNNVRFVPNVS